MKFLVPNYSCLQNPWLRGYRPQIPVLSVLCPQLNLLNTHPNKIPGYATVRRGNFLHHYDRVNHFFLFLLHQILLGWPNWVEWDAEALCSTGEHEMGAQNLYGKPEGQLDTAARRCEHVAAEPKYWKISRVCLHQRLAEQQTDSHDQLNQKPTTSNIGTGWRRQDPLKRQYITWTLTVEIGHSPWKPFKFAYAHEPQFCAKSSLWNYW